MRGARPTQLALLALAAFSGVALAGAPRPARAQQSDPPNGVEASFPCGAAFQQAMARFFELPAEALAAHGRDLAMLARSWPGAGADPARASVAAAALESYAEFAESGVAALGIFPPRRLAEALRRNDEAELRTLAQLFRDASRPSPTAEPVRGDSVGAVEGRWLEALHRLRLVDRAGQLLAKGSLAPADRLSDTERVAIERRGILRSRKVRGREGLAALLAALPERWQSELMELVSWVARNPSDSYPAPLKSYLSYLQSSVETFEDPQALAAAAIPPRAIQRSFAGIAGHSAFLFFGTEDTSGGLLDDLAGAQAREASFAPRRESALRGALIHNWNWLSGEERSVVRAALGLPPVTPRQILDAIGERHAFGSYDPLQELDLQPEARAELERAFERSARGELVGRPFVEVATLVSSALARDPAARAEVDRLYPLQPYGSANPIAVACGNRDAADMLRGKPLHRIITYLRLRELAHRKDLSEVHAPFGENKDIRQVLAFLAIEADPVFSRLDADAVERLAFAGLTPLPGAAIERIEAELALPSRGK